MLRALPLCTCCRHYPGAATGRPACSFTQPYQPSPIWQSGRPAHRPFRGLLGVHSRYGLHTRAVTVFRDTLHRRLQPLRYLHDCSGCFRLERLPGGAYTRWEKRRLCTAHARNGQSTRLAESPTIQGIRILSTSSTILTFPNLPTSFETDRLIIRCPRSGDGAEPIRGDRRRIGGTEAVPGVHAMGARNTINRYVRVVLPRGVRKFSSRKGLSVSIHR